MRLNKNWPKVSVCFMINLPESYVVGLGLEFDAPSSKCYRVRQKTTTTTTTTTKKKTDYLYLGSE